MPQLINALIDTDAAYKTMSLQALSSERIQAAILEILLGPDQLYEELRKVAE